MEELVCPITLEFLEDPVQLPCCGRAVSRQPIIAWLSTNPICPLCKKDINIDMKTVAKIVNLAYQVEEAKKNQLSEKKEEDSKSGWKAEIYSLTPDSVYQTVIGQLRIVNTDDKFNFKTLLVPVIDKSGSMGGPPINQAVYSLNRILDLTFRNKKIKTNIVLYDDIGVTIDVTTMIPQKDYQTDIANQVMRMGGTSFTAAFNEIIKVCSKYKDVDEITSIVVLFLTDGEDSSTMRGNRKTLVDKFNIDVKKVWNKPITIHSIGFGHHHDFDFLNALRQIGTTEGAYRYADPTEDVDSLSNKINSILNVISESSSVPIKLLSTDLQIIGGDDGKYWINLTGVDSTKSQPITIKVNDKDNVDIVALFKIYIDSKNEEDERELREQWQSYLIDQMASETLELSKNSYGAIEKSLYCELLTQRARAMLCRIDNSSSDGQRLLQLLETINSIKIGGEVNEKKLSDLMFEGKFATQKTEQKSVISQSVPLITMSQTVVRCVPKNLWVVVPKESVRCTSQMLSCNGSHYVINWIDANEDKVNDVYGPKNSNMLITCASIGRINILEHLLKNKHVNKIQVNDIGYNAADLAAVYGYWKSFDILVDHGLKPTIEGGLLLRTCIANKYYKTAERLIKNGFSQVTDEMVDNAPTAESAEWLSKRSSKIISLETAIIKGMIENIEDKIKLDNIGVVSWKPYLDIIMKPLSDDHLKIFELLIENKKLDTDESLDIIDSEGTPEITTPFFVACEKNNKPLFNLLAKRMNTKNINWQNKKGTTPLWIASCNRHIDIVMELVNMGADVNIANNKGDGPLVPCCQKGSTSIVELLITCGAKLSVYNKERDNTILIAARYGHDKILDILFNTMNDVEKKAVLKQYAEIDGLVPILAATEMDKSSTIKICVNHGADLETRTSDDNKILPGATSVHLASYYGRLNALKTLCELGANYTSKTTVHGWTPLHIALKQGHSEIVRYLIGIDKKKINLSTVDKDGRSPIYYANMNGNEKIFEEFFVNKLVLEMDKVLKADPETEKRCTDIILKHGSSPGFFEYSELSNLNLGDGDTLLMHTMLNKNNHLYEALKKMGADFNKTDDYGITPAFWAEFLKVKDDIKIDEKTQQMVERVDKSIKSSIQNKLLLNMSTPNNLLLDDTGSINQLTKMSNSSLAKLDDRAMISLKKAKDSNHSILGFVEKLKTNKLAVGANFDYIFWHSKIHLIKLLATDESALQPIHMLALYLYTGNSVIFNNVNTSLINWSESNIWNSIIHTLYQAVSLLPPYNGEVYRAVNINFTQATSGVGVKIQWNNFAVCSKEYRNCSELIAQKTGIVYIIQSKTGKDISKYSKYRVDAEILYNPGTVFVVKNLYKPNVIALGQENIRKSTYAIDESDIAKAEANKASIIVELEEVE